jgi:hypothetical protein
VHPRLILAFVSKVENYDKSERETLIKNNMRDSIPLRALRKLLNLFCKASSASTDWMRLLLSKSQVQHLDLLRRSRALLQTSRALNP